ncbi:hypothetical protein ESZ50_06675 [Weissella muntiaci]|uniref:Uncharacterized protein n=1 Tax=Weissella muntiaci TaxID=2508881 RepID=A0A6C2C5V8_9LACO|nr:hypothetical protein ESZ50_06675 [Weissella muntiaci]
MNEYLLRLWIGDEFVVFTNLELDLTSMILGAL